MKLSDYGYNLPDTAIALYPPISRGTSRLLVLKKSSGEVEDSYYRNLDDFLQPGDLVVINNTKVIPARLLTKTAAGTDRELLLLEKHGKGRDHHSSLVMYRRKIRVGQKLYVGEVRLEIKQVYDNGTALIHSEEDLWELAERAGHVPLPPYMHRNEEPGDRERYQTVFAKEKGSVAAPTASLNLTAELMQRIRGRGVKVTEITLHVGLGTFMPIRVDDVSKHKMHQEYFEISEKTAKAIKQTKEQGGRVVAIGTTVTRTLEYAARQIEEAIGDIAGEADIFIYPGYDFKIIDAMVTNFHAPRSTVLMMAAAFAGWEHLNSAYEHALQKGYRFLSYGDSMLII